MTTKGAKLTNAKFINLSRVVIDPRYRGCGIASDFVAAVCLYDDLVDVRYVELIASMGKVNLFWKKAGFIDYGQTLSNTIGGTVAIGGKSNKRKQKSTLIGNRGVRSRVNPHTWLYEAKGGKVRSETQAQSKLAVMRYYLLDRKKMKGAKFI